MFGKKKEPSHVEEQGKSQLVVYGQFEGSTDLTGAGAVKGKEVAIWNPPISLDGQGQTNISPTLIAGYLTRSLSLLTASDLGTVRIDWGERQGRFVEVVYHIPAWDEEIMMVQPVARISQTLADAVELYRQGMGNKSVQMHKRHQVFGPSNTLIKSALDRLNALVDEETPHMTNAEYLFLHNTFAHALTQSSLLPDMAEERNQVYGTRLSQ